jgi:hypothetical protein
LSGTPPCLSGLLIALSLMRLKGCFWLFILAFILFPGMNGSLHAQKVDSTRHFFPDPSIAMRAKPKLFFSFDTRRSFFSNSDVKISGIKIGLDFKKTMKFGLGLHWLNTPIYRTFYEPDSLGRPDTVVSQLGFGYLAFSSEYVYYRSKRWEFSTALYLGAGSMQFTNRPHTIRNFGLLEPDLNGQYKIFPWLGIGFGGGYRMMMMQDVKLRRSLNNPIYKFGIRLFIGELYKTIFKPEEVSWN